MSEKNPSKQPSSRADEQDLLAALLAEEGIDSEASSEIRPRPDPSGPPPLSFGQFRLWLLDQLQPGTALYNIPAALRMTGRLDVQALEQSLTQIVARHEVLRTTFSTQDGNPYQVIHPPFRVVPSLVDVPGATPAEREAELLRLAHEEIHRSFNLQTGPMLRVLLLRLHPEEHVLVLTLHHIVTDGWSGGILLRELTACYQAFTQGTAPVLPPLPIQYADYATWQREWMTGAVLEEQLAYWRTQLEGTLPTLELPFDFARPAVQDFVGASASFSLGKDVLDGVKELCRRERVTPFMVLLAGFQVFLCRYSGQTDVVVGSPVANRNRLETEGMMGFFVNMLPLRAQLNPATPFLDFLRQVRASTTDAFAHQDLPFERLVEALQSDRNLSHSAIFQVVFALQNAPREALRLSGLTFSSFPVATRTSKFDLCLSLIENANGYQCFMEYNTALFREETAQRWLGHFQNLLRSIVGDPNRPISRLSLLSEGEEKEVLEGWNSTIREYEREKSLGEMASLAAGSHGDRVAVEYGAEQVSYGELEVRSNRVARWLRKKGVKPEVFVGLYLERGIEAVVWMVGIVKAGGAYVPMDVAYPAERVRHMAEDAGLKLAVSQKGLKEKLGGVAGLEVADVEEIRGEIGRESGEAVESGAGGESLAYMIYTSGSTGRPKGVCVTHRGVMRLVRNSGYIELGREDVVGQASNLSFDAATFEVWGALLNGSRLVGITKEVAISPVAFAQELEQRGVNVLFLTTALFNQMAREKAEVFGRMRTVLFGGEKVEVEWVRKVLKEGKPGRLLHVYGPTECTTYATWQLVEEVKEGQETVAIGRGIGNTQVYVLDGERQVVPVGVVGELYIGGDGLARGYWKQEELTREKFVENPFKRGERMYRTGDQVKWNERGELEFVGRKDGQVKIRGFRIELGEIEAEVKKCEGVKEGVVEAREEGGERRLVGYVVWEEGKKSEVRKLREELKKRLPEYMVPAGWVELEKLPLTPNGKVDRKALPAPEGNLSPVEETVGSRTPVEELLCGIWEQLLRRSPVGVTENFFEIGGHSLLATRVMSRVRQTFGVELAVRVIFEGPTVRELGRCVEQARQGGRSSRVPKLERREHGQRTELSFAQQRLWFLDRMGHRAYHIAGAMRLEGAVNEGALEESFNDLVARHESLRTVFGQEEGRGYQEVKESLRVKLEREDWSGLGGEERERKARVRVQEEGEKEFDLEEGPLVRLGLIKLQEQEHLLLLTLHHAIADGWSMEILLREWSQGYEARVKGKEVGKVGEEGVRYRDYAVWQRQWLKGEVLEEELGYWRKRLEGAPGVLELPLDRPRKAVATHRGGRVEVKLGKELTEKLKQLGREEGASLFMVLLAGFQAVLGRYARSEDVVVGTPIANRQREEVEGVIGFFVNTLVLRGEMSGDPNVREWVRRVREGALAAYEHQDVPFEKLVEELAPVRDLSVHPLFQVMFVLQNAPSGRLELEGLKWRRQPVGVGDSKFDILLGMGEGPAGLSGAIEFNRDLFDTATMEALATHLQVLLAGMVASPEAPLSRLPLLTETESRRLVLDWNQTALPLPDPIPCMHELFETQARKTPDAIALMCGTERLTYRELNRRADVLAVRLRAAGVQPETLVGLRMNRSSWLIAGMMGILKAGGAYVPLDPAYPEERVRFMIEDTAAKVVVTERPLLGLPGTERAVQICVEDLDLQMAIPKDESARRPVSSNLGYIIYTSGSTGRPKGVAIEHRNAVAFVYWAQSVFSHEELRSVLAATSVCFDLSIFEIFVTLSSGGRVVLVDNALHLPSVSREAGVTLINTVPSAIAELLKVEGIPDTVRVINLAGEPLRISLVQKLYERTRVPKVFDLYGPSETTTYSTFALRRADGPYTVGRPVGNTQVYLLDRHQKPVPRGVIGEVFIGGAGVARGYLHRPELTAERFLPDPFATDPTARLYRTGDLARYLPDGNLEYLGRGDHQVKIRGFRIELGEIELALSRCPGVKDCTVQVRGEDADKRLLAYVVPTTEDALDVTAIRGLLRGQLPEYMVPTGWVVLEKLPLTPNGKLDRKALPAPTDEAPQEHLAPETEAERMIAEVWCDALGVERVGVQSNFFELGGHSLMLIRVQNELRSRLQREISIVELFQHPTIRSLAQHLAVGRPVSAGRSGLATASRVVEAEPVAIVGMAGRFPGAGGPEQFWRNLRDGVESIRFFSDEELRRAGVPEALLSNPRYVKARALIDGIELFDAPFFNLNPREAEIIDPQQRVFLECAWEALEDAGHDPDGYPGAIGVCAGLSMNSYLFNNLLANPSALGSNFFLAKLGNDKDSLATRVSYKLNLKGPSYTVQTACSTSLVAVDLACRALMSGQARMMLAGGVSIQVPQVRGYLFQEEMILSSDGHCRAFDAKATGTVEGQGAGVVVLKRLSDALAEGDRIYAVIRGWAVNNDGALKVSYTAPQVEGQAEVIRAAQQMAGVAPSSIGYVEAHGTGTHLGDPIEIEALSQAFGGGSRGDARCAIGSVKTNIGHLDAAAGVAGLIKTALALWHREIPPSLNFSEANPEIDFARLGFEVNSRLMPWPVVEGMQRRAGVSSFGVGGTNAHVVLEEAPSAVAQSGSSSARPYDLVVLSARTPAALERVAHNLGAHIRSHPELTLSDIAHTLRTGRHPFECRQVLVTRSTADAAAALEDPARAGVLTSTAEPVPRRVAFLFSGQGSQYPQMGRELFAHEEVYRRWVRECLDLLKDRHGLDLGPVLLGELTTGEAAVELQDTALAQPALFVVEYALAQLWISWGVQPDAMLGHSIGEYVAACLAGVMSLEDALGLVKERGRLMQLQPAGAMTAVSRGSEELQALLAQPDWAGTIFLAAVNSPRLSVVSGPVDAIERFERAMANEGCGCRRLHTSHAFHSPMMDAAARQFGEVLRTVTLRAPHLRFVSNVTGTWIRDEQASDPDYWVQQLREPVRFAPGLATLSVAGVEVMIEVGPGNALATLARSQVDARVSVFTSLRHAREQVPDVEHLLGTLGRLWLLGQRVDWTEFGRGRAAKRIGLPTYPFERQRYWVEPKPVAAGTPPPSAPRKAPLDGWFSFPSWTRAVPGGYRGQGADAVAPGETWLILDCDKGGADVWEDQVRSRGAIPVSVSPGLGFRRAETEGYEMGMDSEADAGELCDELKRTHRLPRRVLVILNGPRCEQRSAAEPPGFLTLLHLVQALDRAGAQEVDITLVVHGVADVEAQDPSFPERAAVLGLGRVIPQEFPLFRCRVVDSPASAGAVAVVEEIVGGFDDAMVAHRGGQRWVPVMQPLRVPAPQPGASRLREKGVYLITGGLGGVGLKLAGHLARACQARLVLLGRTGLPPRSGWDELLSRSGTEERTVRAIRAIREMEAAGALVRVDRADVADEAAMRSLVESIRTEFGELNGVIHAAGSISGSSVRPLSRLTGPACQEQFGSKVVGTQVLERLLQGSSLDFCLLTSSLSAILGGLGFGAYAAANAYLDAVAVKKHRQGEPNWISVAWDGWKADDTVRSSVGLGKELQELTIEAAEGTQAFDRILSLKGLPRVAVSTTDLGVRMERWNRPRSDVPPANPLAVEASAAHPRPNLFTPYVGAGSELEAKVAAIWQDLLGIDRVGVNDNFFELGGNSLLGTELIARMKRELSAPLSLASLFEGPTVRALTALLNGPAPSPNEANTGRASQRNELLARRKASSQKRRDHDPA